MKILGASVLIAESMTMGFAILIAMKNASNLVKSYADDITDYDNENDGVGKYLEKFFKNLFSIFRKIAPFEVEKAASFN